MPDPVNAPPERRFLRTSSTSWITLALPPCPHCRSARPAVRPDRAPGGTPRAGAPGTASGQAALPHRPLRAAFDCLFGQM
ncbi:hypothetical protein GCM10010279_16120 [Streptomyces mutabilis]|nr:hypothetical protein GCM10010279_16120 [Streptomyces mutabilis]